MNAEPASPHRALRHGAIVAGFSAFIAVALSIARGDWVLQFVYAESIGLSIWACTELGRYLLGIDPQAGWRWAVLQVAAVVAGYTIGTELGDLYCGCSSFEFFRRSPRTLASYLVLSVAITGAISYFFISRGRDQRRQREIATAQRDAAEARLKLLESQLEPHMLFNTLANLRALIAVDPQRAQAMLDQLIAFLRATLGASRVPFHALDAEFARVADYLALMQARMGSRLETKLDLPADLATLQVPPLVLQPLVENAIHHGIARRAGAGKIVIRARGDADSVQITVSDDGAGITSDAVPEGVGLSNSRLRLEQLYGGRGRLVLKGHPGSGAEAVVTIPRAGREPERDR